MVIYLDTELPFKAEHANSQFCAGMKSISIDEKILEIIGIYWYFFVIGEILVWVHIVLP